MSSENDACNNNYQLNIESAPYAVFVVDGKGKHIEVNKAACQIFGYTKDELLSMSFSDYLAPECIESGIDHFKRVQKNGHAFGEYIFLRKTGEKIWASVAATRTSRDQFIAFCWDITKEKVAEGALKESEEKYRMVVENSQEAIIIVQDEVVKFANAAVEKITQVPREEIIGFNMRKYIQMEDRALVVDRYRHRIKGDIVPSYYDFRVIGKGGMIKWVQVSVVSVTWEGRPATLNFLLDITSRKSAEDALRKSEQFTRFLIDNVLAGMLIIDPKTHTILDANAAAVEMIGTEKENIIGAVCHKFICPSEEGACPVTDLGLKVDNAERVLIRANGNLIPIIKTARLITTGKKPYIIESFLNITERKRSEDALKKAHDELENRIRERTEELSVANMQLKKAVEDSSQLNAALEDSQKNLLRIFESLDDVYYRADIQGIALNASPSCTKVLGWTPDELIGTKIIKLYNDSAERDRFIAALAEKRILHDYEISLKHKDGRLITVSINSHFVIDGNGNKVGIEGTFRDITGRKKMEESISRQATSLAILNQVIMTANRAENLTKLLEDVLEVTMSLLNYSGGGIYLVDATTGSANLATYRHLPMEFIEEIKTIPIKTPPYDTLFVNNKPIITDNYAALAPERAKKFGLASLVSIPLVSRGVVVGALNVACSRRQVIPEEEIAILVSIGHDVGSTIGRILAEKETQQSVVNLQTLFNSVTEMVFVLDMEGHILRVNNAVKKSLHYSDDELLGKDVLFVHVPEGYEEALMNVRGMIEGTIDSCPVPLLAKDGSRIDVETKVTRGIWDGKEVLIGVSRDITERKRAEEALRASEEQFALAIEGSAAMLWDLNIQTGMMKITDLWAEFLGYTLAELTPFSFDKLKNLTAQEDMVKLYNVLDRHLRGETAKFEYETRLRHKDGRWLWVMIRGKVVERNDTGQPVRMTGTSIDVTGRKNVDDKLQQISNRLKLATGAANIGIWDWDISTNTLLWDDIMYRIYGITPERFSGVYEAWESMLHPDDFKKGHDAIQKAIRGESEFNPEFRIIWPDRSIHYIKANSLVQRDSTGKAIRIVGTNWDITDKKLADIAFEKLNNCLVTLSDDPLKNINTLTSLCGEMVKGTCALYNRINGDMIESVGQWNTPPGYVATDKAEGHICTDVAKLSPGQHAIVIHDLRQTHYARSDPNVEKYQLDTYIGSAVQIENKNRGTLCVVYQHRYEPSELEQMIIVTIARRIGIEEDFYFSRQHMLDLLREREILLKEIHHRVKNNMQVISSLLMLQRKQISNPETRDLLIDAENRVFSIALIHEKLYQSESLSMIEFQPYLVQMGDNVYTSRDVKPDQISLTVTAPGIILPIDKAIPLSLISNELLTNSLKHAFPDGRKGRITIDVNHEEDSIFYRFSDDGIGFPVGLDFTRTETLGMQLISGLTLQLFGTITMKQENGTTFEIRFPLKHERT